MAVSAKSEDARASALDKFIKNANSKNSGAVFTEFTAPMDADVVSTGALSLDYVLGVGGLPRGRVVELYGPEGSGKTSLALSVCAQAIAEGGSVGYVDVENALNFEHVHWMGVDTRFFAVSQPDSGEDALQQVEAMCESGLFSVVVVDSVASLVPRAELEGDIGDTHVGLTARLMSQALRKLVGVANRTNTLIIFINQLREKVGQMYGNPETTPGGRALKYYSSVRLEVRSPASKQIKEGTGTAQRVTGQICAVTVKKNKMAAPFRSAEYRLMYGQGVDSSSAVLDVAVATGVWFTRPGGMYFDATTGEQIGRGREQVTAQLAADSDFCNRVREQVVAQMRSAVRPEAIDDPSVDGDPDVPGAVERDVLGA